MKASKLNHFDSQKQNSKTDSPLSDLYSAPLEPYAAQTDKLNHQDCTNSSVSSEIYFSPNLSERAKIIIPISFTRYDSSPEKTKIYDAELDSLFRQTAHLLSTNQISSVDILSSGGLQAINWGQAKAQEIESYFLKRHYDLLKYQSKTYTWESWIAKSGADMFQKTYERVIEDSNECTEWYKLMVKTHEKSSVSNDLEKSLEYQRKEYAGILLMHNYTNLVYMGHISPAWSYLYHKYHKESPPIFTRVAVKLNPKRTEIKKADASHTIRMILGNIEETLASANFPENEKRILVENAMSLFYTYGPKEP